MSMILKAEGLQSLSFEGEELSPAVSFTLREGEVLLMKGENGRGKSSLMKTLLGLHKRYRGSYELVIEKTKIQYLPQLGTLNFHIPLTMRDLLPPQALNSPLLRGVNLDGKWNTASGGERQKVLLATALSLEPRLLFLDEPFNHVDHESGLVLEKSLWDFLQTHPQSSLVLISHREFTQGWPTVKRLEVR